MKTFSTPKWRGKPTSPEPNCSPPSTPQNVSQDEASEAGRNASPFHTGNPDLSLCGIFQKLAVRDTPYMRQRLYRDAEYSIKHELRGPVAESEMGLDSQGGDGPNDDIELDSHLIPSSVNCIDLNQHTESDMSPLLKCDLDAESDHLNSVNAEEDISRHGSDFNISLGFTPEKIENVGPQEAFPLQSSLSGVSSEPPLSNSIEAEEIERMHPETTIEGFSESNELVSGFDEDFGSKTLMKPGSDVLREPADLTILQDFDPLIARRESVMNRLSSVKAKEQDLLKFDEFSPLKLIKRRSHGSAQEEAASLEVPFSPSRHSSDSIMYHSLTIRSQDLVYQEKLMQRNKKIALLDEEIAWMNARNKAEKAAIEQQIAEEDIILQRSAHMIQEYQQTMEEIAKEKDRVVQENQAKELQAMKEQDRAVEDLKQTEAAFNDVHKKYEQKKAFVSALKKNVTILESAISESSERLEKGNEKYEKLREKGTEVLASVAEEMGKVTATREKEVNVLESALRETEAKIAAGEEEIQEKDKLIEELNSMIDALVSKAQK